MHGFFFYNRINSVKYSHITLNVDPKVMAAATAKMIYTFPTLNSFCEQLIDMFENKNKDSLEKPQKF